MKIRPHCDIIDLNGDNGFRIIYPLVGLGYGSQNVIIKQETSKKGKL